MKNENIALVVTEVEHSAMSTLLFCNHQCLLNGWIHIWFWFLDVDRHEWKKQAQSITFEQAWLHMPQNVLGFECSLTVISLESIDIRLWVFECRYALMKTTSQTCYPWIDMP